MEIINIIHVILEQMVSNSYDVSNAFNFDVVIDLAAPENKWAQLSVTEKNIFWSQLPFWSFALITV